MCQIKIPKKKAVLIETACMISKKIPSRSAVNLLALN